MTTPANARTLAVDRSRLPALAPAGPFTFPAIDKSVLANGLRIWTVRHAQVPVVSMMLLFQRGAASDPSDKSGLAALTADMLDEGSGDRSSIEMHEAIARLGGQLDTDIASDATLVGLTVIARFAGRALTLLADVVARPALRDDDFARVRQLRLHRLTQLRDVPGAIADRAFVKLLYGSHPYGHTPLGTEQTLAAATADDVRSFHAGILRPRAATLIAVGDCQHDEIRRLATEAFAGWEGVVTEAEWSDQISATPPRLSVVPRPGAPQSELRMGHVAAARDTPDYHALIVANMVLGGQFSSRINLNLREDKGFTYGARTAFDFRRGPGPFALQVGVRTDATARSIEESIAEISGMRGSRPVTPQELALAAAGLTLGYPRGFETAEQIARGMTQLALHDLPDDYFAQFVPRVQEVTADDVTRVMARHLDPSRITTVVVGDLDVIGADLRRLGLGEPVVLSSDTF